MAIKPTIMPGQSSGPGNLLASRTAPRDGSTTTDVAVSHDVTHRLAGGISRRHKPLNARARPGASKQG